MPSSPHSARFEAYRPVVMGRHGMVCSGHPLASQAGIAMLQKGGNAVDAAIATAAALNVTEPLMSGIGGDGYIMVYWQQTGGLEVSNGTGAAPLAADPDHFRAHGIPLKGILSVSAPGLVHSWLDAHQRYGSLPLAEVLAPAIDLAENGFPVSHVLAAAIAADPWLARFPSSAAVFCPGGKPLRAGEILYQRDLARTFQAIAREGRDAFYRGEVARALVRCSQEQGGLLTLDDLAQCRARWEAPIATTYHGHTVYEAPPNSSGHVLLQELNLVEQFDLKTLGCNTAQSVHLMVEAKKLAFSDREAYVADPDFVDVPTQGLIAKEYAKERAKLIDLERAMADAPPGDPWPWQPGGTARKPAAPSGVTRAQEDTTCFVVVDGQGNAVCQLQSLQGAWGSSLIAEGTGVLLNNRMTYWHLDPNHPDCLQPGKRVRHTMNPVMVFRDAVPLGKGEGRARPEHSRRDGGQSLQLVLVCGTPGADTQVQTNLQVITHVLDFGMTVAEAVEAPRWRNTQSPTESNIPHVCKDELLLESRFPQEARAELQRRGHALNVIGDWAAAGSEMMIQIDPKTGALHGAADPRRDGYAIGW
ncbi:MAG: gamma-glutamyltransferase [SAR202 cluster bacterium]|nr:gamma-glutamyltransferase [SAR202 cluster bacterium]